MITPSLTPVRPPLPLWLAVVVAACAGALLDLAFPSVSLWIAAPVAICLLLVALMGRRAGGALLVGVVFGLVFYLLLVSWTSRYLGPLPWTALSALEALLTGVGLIPVALAYRWLPRASPRPALRVLLVATAVAALWVGRELLIGTFPYGGFPWARVGYTLVDTPAAMLASWIGVSGLSFVLVFFVAALVEVLRLSWERRSPFTLRGLVPALTVPIVALLALLLVPAFPTTAGGELRVGAVQGNGPTGYFDAREPLAIIASQIDASRPLFGEDIDLLVWPEGSVEGDPFQNPTLARMLSRVVAQADAPLLANAATAVGDRYFNTSFLWDVSRPAPARDDTQTHAKRHPVPFGEYVPDRAFFNAIVPDLIGLIQREYTPGTDAPVMTLDHTAIGLAICFDVIYDDVIREGINGGAELLVFQTNNADFRGTDENLQQLAIARMRAIETGRTVVNISTVGTSQVIRADGSTQAALDADRPGAMLEDVELRTGATAGVVVAPVLEPILLWGGVLLVLLGWFRERRSSRS